VTLPALYHYTCHHGHLGIGDEGKLYAPVYLGARFPPGALSSALVVQEDRP
jgi:hypothetical protein